MEHIYRLYVHSVSSVHDIQAQLCYNTVLCLCSILQYNCASLVERKTDGACSCLSRHITKSKLEVLNKCYCALILEYARIVYILSAVIKMVE